MNRASQKMCENDVKQKHHAQGLDDRMQILRNTSGQIGFHPGIETVDNTWVHNITAHILKIQGYTGCAIVQHVILSLYNVHNIIII